MDFSSKISAIVNTYKANQSIEIINCSYDSKNFGNFIIEIRFNEKIYRLINDRGELYIDKYSIDKKEWENMDFYLSRVSLDNIETALHKAIDYISYYQS